MKKTTFLLLGLALMMLFLEVKPVSASYLFVNPSSSSISQNSTLSLQVKLNTEGEVINGVSAYLSVPLDKFDISSIQINSQALPIVAEQTIDGNIVKFSGANLSSVQGSDVLIGTINLQPKTTGSASLSFVPGSAVPRTLDSSDSLNLGTSQGASITITAADNSSSPGPNPSGSFNCQDASIKNNLTNFSQSANGIKARLDTIYALVDDYYNSSGQNRPDYLSQRQMVDSKRVGALTDLSNFNSNSPSFACKLQNARDQLNHLKQQGQQIHDEFTSYQQALKKLINILRNS